MPVYIKRATFNAAKWTAVFGAAATACTLVTSFPGWGGVAAIVAGGALATAMISWVVNGGDRPATATMVTLAFAAAIACAVGGPLISPQTLMLTRFATTGYIATAGATILEHMRR